MMSVRVCVPERAHVCPGAGPCAQVEMQRMVA